MIDSSDCHSSSTHLILRTMDTDLLLSVLATLSHTDTYWTRARRDFVYIVDFPEGYFLSCAEIVRTCEEFHMFGASTPPTYRGAASVHTESDDHKRRAAIVHFARALLHSLPLRKHLEVYTIDEDLLSMLAAQIPELEKDRIESFETVRIIDREAIVEKIRMEPYAKDLVSCALCGTTVRRGKLPRHMEARCHRRARHDNGSNKTSGGDVQ